MEVRWGIVGLGRFADGRIAPAIEASEAGRLTACAGTRSKARLKEFASRHGVGAAYLSHEELVRDPEIDAVYVTAPNALHHPIVLAAAAAGKHVLCDKPMALNAGEAQEMIDACRTAGVTLRVGLQCRFEPVLRAAAEIGRSGRIGLVREVSVQRHGPGRNLPANDWRYDLALAGSGAIVDLGLHAVDFIQWILGERITRVLALADPPRASGRPDETSTLLLELSDGCQATVRCSRAMPIAANDLQVFGEKGMLATGPIGPYRTGPADRLILRTSEGSEEMEFPSENLYLRQIETFACELAGDRPQEGGEPRIATGEDGLQLTQVTDALIRSLETGSFTLVENGG